MKQESIRTFFESVCALFKNATITLSDSGENVLYSQPSDRHLLFPCNREALYYENNASDFLYVLPVSDGLTMYMQDRTSDMEQTRERVKMVKALLLLTKEKEDLIDKNEKARDSLALLTSRLIYSPSTDSSTLFAMKIVESGFNLTCQRVACIFDISYANSVGDYAEGGVLKDITYVLNLYNCEQHEFINQDIITPVNHSQIVLFKSVSKSGNELKENLYTLLSRVCEKIEENRNVKIIVGVGTVSLSVTDYARSLSMVKSVLSVSKQLNSEKKIRFINDFDFELEISHLRTETVSHFFASPIHILTEHNLIETVQALFQTNMDIELSAQKLYVHKNTVVFRLNQIRKLLHINPLHSDSDRFRLYMIYICSRLFPEI